jgi:hypothetical protein
VVARETGDHPAVHESARKQGKTIGGAGVTDESMLSMAFTYATRR